MQDATELIEKLITEHKQIAEDVQSCAQYVDVEQVKKLDTAKDTIVPGRIEDHKFKAAQLERELMEIDKALKRHFNCEEESLLKAFEREKLPKLASLLRSLIKEHEQIIKHLADLKKQVADLAADKLSQAIWQEKAWSLKPRMAQLREMIRTHAGKEEELFMEARETIKSQKG